MGRNGGVDVAGRGGEGQIVQSLRKEGPAHSGPSANTSGVMK